MQNEGEKAHGQTGILPVVLQEALEQAAKEVKAAPPPQSILPENQVTRAVSTTSHLITQDYIVRLRYAGKNGALSSDAQVALGAAIGLAVPAVEGLYRIYSSLQQVSIVQALSVLGFGISVGVYAIIQRAGSKSESVDQICSEIESREKTTAV
jgi:hypothetical protein